MDPSTGDGTTSAFDSGSNDLVSAPQYDAGNSVNGSTFSNWAGIAGSFAPFVTAAGQAYGSTLNAQTAQQIAGIQGNTALGLGQDQLLSSLYGQPVSAASSLAGMSGSTLLLIGGALLLVVMLGRR